MRTLRLNAANTTEIANAAAEQLRDGAVIAAPTETVYGLMTAWSNTAGRERISQLKRRSPDKHLQMLAPDLEAAHRVGLLQDARIQAIAEAFWPGPLTLVCPAKGSYETIGLRIPDHAFVLALLRCLEQPLAATSANLSGTSAATVAEEAGRDLDGLPDLLIDGGKTVGQASTVASVVGGDLTIFREGPVAADALRGIWASPV
ncbi:MAG: threonylcarbamoyl-AMP synthase [Lentisphaerae bacterium]|jgi:L-threonylcarbamoyladenylate synthase|nr:threonylcarbamoyl-AMP synthase [Lentisphaerota bacterium]MBT4819361.1 threonylcarbamoyl-AMP synthase [Lentisphaerota bacterium]MBT5610780.1 threonylcarbamoyl-AMP synthase [Lentisphaerota bacterium]MBT7053788.1 threonylcarbamoyl-AMP synthase [Lentisphaerota bacterium]MBT7841249.1 threonylcarbamoyl-AMP synthase [Lentisphaerota bacterium]